MCFFFFFQAEDGIRDVAVTGVQTCALPILRDRRAREVNRPPFKVLSDLLLAEVARRQPRTEEEVQRVPGAQAAVLRRLAPEILEAVRAGQSGAPPPRPRPERGPPWRRGGPDPEVEERYEKLRTW